MAAAAAILFMHTIVYKLARPNFPGYVWGSSLKSVLVVQRNTAGIKIKVNCLDTTHVFLHLPKFANFVYQSSLHKLAKSC